MDSDENLNKGIGNLKLIVNEMVDNVKESCDDILKVLVQFLHPGSEEKLYHI